MAEYKKIYFHLERDEDGYPPVAVESMWAIQLLNGRLRIDNIPFYMMGISCGDEVEALLENGELWFKSLTKKSGNSTFRIIPIDPQFLEKIRVDLNALGCQSECHKKAVLIAVEVPASVSIQPFLNYIVEAQKKGILDFEEAALRHAI